MPAHRNRPRPQQIATTPPPAARGDDADALEQSDTDDEQAQLQRLLAEFSGGEGYAVRIERMRDVGMRQELAGYLGTLSLGPDLYDDALQTWGGGRYRGRVYQGNVYKANIQFQIAGEPRARAEAPAPAAIAAPSRTDLVLEQLAAAVAALVTAQSKPPQPPTNALDDMAKMAKMLKDLQPPAPAQSDPLQLFTMFDSMLELRKKVAEETGTQSDTGGMLALVREGVVPMVGLMREKLDQDREARGSGAARAAHSATVAPAKQVSSSPPDSPIAQLAARIPTIGRSFLAGAAKSNKDPQLYAELVLDQLPPELYAQLPTLLKQQDFTWQLLALVPQWAPFPHWFAELSRAMLESVTAEIVVDQDQAPGAAAAEGAA